MKLDAEEERRGTEAMLSRQRAAAREYQTFWEGAIAKKQTAEKAAEDASWARYQANLEKKKSADAIYFQWRKAQIEQDAAIQGISSGSGGFSWSKVEKKIEKEGKHVGAEIAEAGAEGVATGAGIGVGIHVSKSIFREMQVLLHEGIGGRWKQFVSSFSRLLGFMGLTAETLLTSIPIIGTGVAAIWGNIWMRRSIKEQAGGYGTIAGTEGTEKIIGKRLEEEIHKLYEAGKITGAQRESFIHQLGSLSGIRNVQRALGGMLPQGYDTFLPSAAEQIRQLDKEAEAKRKEMEQTTAHREKEKTLAEDIAAHEKSILTIKQIMANVDKDSVRYHQLNLDLVSQQLELQKLQNQQVDQNTKAQAEAARQAKEDAENRTRIEKEYTRNWARDRIHMAMDEAQFPEIEMLAGTTWMERLKFFYENPRGRGYLGRGNGPFGGPAREYELAKYQQIWDRTYGNIGDAENDRQRMIAARNQLILSGAASPEMLLGKIEDNTRALAQLTAAMIQNGMLIRDDTTPISVQQILGGT